MQIKEAVKFWLVVVLFIGVMLSVGSMGCASKLPKRQVQESKLKTEYKKAEKQNVEEWLQSCLRTQPWKPGTVGEYICPRLLKMHIKTP